jgi:hypothetical protein
VARTLVRAAARLISPLVLDIAKSLGHLTSYFHKFRCAAGEGPGC